MGPPRGSVVVVGGGAQGPEIYAKFIELAGGPDALIIDVPTAGGDTVYNQSRGGGLRAAGAKNVYVLHTKDRSVADADSFVAPVLKAGGVWFEGGRHYHLVDSYLGTKTEQAFHDVLARGGVVGGSSAGASILGSFLVRGAPSNNNRIMAHPDYLKGFGFLRGVAVDQHVVARERLADLADSITPRWPQLLSISEDEGTAWVVRGDIGEIIGRNKAFAYNGKETDPGKPYLTLRPGDRYDMAARRVVHRAMSESPLTAKFVDDILAGVAAARGAMATVVVARDGKVLYNKAYGVPAQRAYMPETAMPNFAVGAMGEALNAIASRSGGRGGAAAATGTANAATNGRGAGRGLGRGNAPGGMQRIAVDSATGAIHTNVDDLHRFERALSANRAFSRDSAPELYSAGTALGWTIDRFRGFVRQGTYGTADGKLNAYVRFPEQNVAVIILTNVATADARGMAERIAETVLATSR